MESTRDRDIAENRNKHKHIIIQRAKTWFSSIGLYSFGDQMQLNRVFDCLDYIVADRVIDVAN